MYEKIILTYIAFIYTIHVMKFNLSIQKLLWRVLNKIVKPKYSIGYKFFYHGSEVIVVEIYKDQYPYDYGIADVGCTYIHSVVEESQIQPKTKFEELF